MEQNEVALTLSEITDSTAVINCEYSPAKSILYQLQLGEAVSNEYRESMEFTAVNLNGGTKYDVVAKTYDAEHKQVGVTIVNFMTTGGPDNGTKKPILDPNPRDTPE